MVPKAQICGAEIENFAENPILLDICLTLRAETNRVAVMTTGPVDPNSDIGSLNHVLVFQYSAKDGRWMYINPPNTLRALNKRNFKG